MGVDTEDEAPAAPPRSAGLATLAGLLALESIAVFGAAVLLIVDLATLAPTSLSSSIALLVLVLVLGVLVAAVAVAAWRQRPWIRGAAITWQVMQLAVAWMLIDGGLAPALGWLAVAASVLGIVLAVMPSTQRSLSPRAPVPSDPDAR